MITIPESVLGEIERAVPGAAFSIRDLQSRPQFAATIESQIANSVLQSGAMIGDDVRAALAYCSLGEAYGGGSR